MKRKILVVIINRANYTRIKSVLVAIQKHKDLELKIAVGASMLLPRFGEAVNVFIDDGFKVDEEIWITLEGENPITMAKSTGIGLLELPTLFKNQNPDVVVTIADRYETLGTAVAASYMNIPLAHTQGGEVSGSIDNSVRNAITKLAHLHFVTNDSCAKRVRDMGEDPKRIFVTGCPSIDLAKEVANDPGKYIKKYSKKVGLPIDHNKPFILVVQHPVTTEYKDAAFQIRETMEALIELQMPSIILYPNVDAGSYSMVKEIQHMGVENLPNFHFYKNLPPEFFLALLAKASCILGNSSAGIRESSFFGTPSVTIGSRQQNRERANNVIEVIHDASRIKEAVKTQLKQRRYKQSNLYGDGRAGEKIADLLAKVELDIIKK